MSDLTELGHRQELLKQELVRLSRHPAHIHKLTEDERMTKLLELQDELRLVQVEIEKEAQAQQTRHLATVYGTGPVAENAQVELKAAETELEKVLAGFTSQTRGYAVKVHDAYVRYHQAANAAGNRVHLDSLVNAGAQKLAAVVEQAVRFGN